MKGPSLYNFRCPVCLDSKKSKSKSRGYFYAKGNDLFFRCHNCGCSNTFGNFIKNLDEVMYKEYILERWRNGENGHSNYKKPIEKDIIVSNINWRSYFLGYQSLEVLEDSHYAKQYILGRQIPKEFLSEIFYVEDFKEFIDKIVPDNKHDLPESDDRIVIPIINKDKKLVAVQGRALNNPYVRYITIKVLDEHKIYGMNRVDLSKKVYIFEGPFDSMFIPNSIAMSGADCPIDALPKNIIFVYDNEPRNLSIVRRMENIILMGLPIVIWPNHIKEKDINDMVKNGINCQEVIDNNTYKGMEAALKMAMWRKV